MANKALGRDLGDLLSRAQPARLLDRAAAKSHSGPGTAPSSNGNAGESKTPETPERPADGTPVLRRAVSPTGPGMSMTAGSLGFFVLDLLLLVVAVWVMRSGGFSYAGGGLLASLSVLLGAVCGCLGVLTMAAASSRSEDRQSGSKIRVQLKR
ncbi:MAG: hypothetical protein JNK85_16145 [Verrucomicrobiales bacterium]|nr:hypothetical protein [Verrucomicrobiales bacterium]